MKTTSKEIYLTFDDGPVPGPTEFVLETLRSANAKATFFCIGDNVKKNPSVFKKIRDDGHAVGNHTFNHLSGWKTRTASYVDNIELCASAIQSEGGGDRLSVIGSADQSGVVDHQPPTTSYQPLFRPPYGRITRNQIRNLSKYQIIMWDVLTHDYAKGITPESCLKGSIAATRPGSIIVFHDSYKAEKNMSYVLPRFIDNFVNQGYEFKSMR